MDNITIESLINHIRTYNACEEQHVRKAYEFAAKVHENQIRQSGAPYISHPLAVAYLLSNRYADKNTICAGLLHDVIEDSKGKITKEDIEREFNPEVALLVDGVTKLSKMNFSTKQDEICANTRKIIESIMVDIRIIIIKINDRLHNMRTLQFKSLDKQKENAAETMELYAPLAYFIGDYRTKSELEDLSFKYLKPAVYEKIEKIRDKIEQENIKYLEDMAKNITKLLKANGIECEIKIRVKNIYGIYKRLQEKNDLNDIHDLFSLKIITNDIDKCYLALRHIHNIYKPINNKFKDYICNPKQNLYQSLHTTVFGRNKKLIQIQIRTLEMDKIASFGLTAYWEEQKGLARDLMQKDLREKFQFYKTLSDISSMFSDNQEFIKQAKKELLSEKIYVYTPSGDIIQLPKGATLLEAAYKIKAELGHTMIYGFVNNKKQDCNYVLNNKDIIFIVTDPQKHDNKGLLLLKK